jgi:hypothetical protein
MSTEQTESLIKDIVKLGEEIFCIDNMHPSMLSVSVFCLDDGGFRSSLIFSSELHAEGKTLTESLEKLKSYLSIILKEKIKKELNHPKSGTVFLDLTMPEPTPNIVVCVYEERGKDFGEQEDQWYVCTTNSLTTREKDVWGALDEYHQYLSEGKIKIIWEPK